MFGESQKSAVWFISQSKNDGRNDFIDDFFFLYLVVTDCEGPEKQGKMSGKILLHISTSIVCTGS